jgi:hypothetical protein
MKRKLIENLRRVEQRIADACGKAGRDPKKVRLVAVTKYATPDVLRTLAEIGVKDFGENRVQELARRAAMVREWIGRRAWDPSAPPLTEPNWHMVGHLQRNKVRAVLPWIAMIHSLDSLRLAEEIDSSAGKLGRKVPVLLQVNASGEASKQGVAVAATTHLAEQISSLKHLELRGLMSMAPLTADTGIIRHTFQRVRELYDEVVGEKLCGPQFNELSIGMSNDFELAIEFGATYLRIGSALFEGIELAAEPETIEQG